MWTKGLSQGEGRRHARLEAEPLRCHEGKGATQTRAAKRAEAPRSGTSQDPESNGLHHLWREQLRVHLKGWTPTGTRQREESRKQWESQGQEAESARARV